MKESPPVERAIFVLVAAYPVVLLSVRNGMSVCFVGILAASLYYLAQDGCKNIAKNWHRADSAFCIAFSLPAIAVFISEIYHKNFQLGSLDGPSRFLLSVPIYLALKRLPAMSPALEYGLPLGAIAGLFASIAFPSIYWPGQGTYFADPTAFGGALLVLGMLSLGAVQVKDQAWLLAIKLAGFGGGILGAIKSSERGVWIAAPAMLIIVYRRWLATARGIALIVTITMCGVSSYWLVPTVHARIDATKAEIANIQSGNLNTSIGIRLQIWRAALEAVTSRPVIGFGERGAKEKLRTSSGNDRLSPAALEQGLAQIHNEILGNALRHGLFGVLAVLMIYAIPLILFIKQLNGAESTAATLGIAFIAAYAIFGLTVETFNIKMIATFYAVTVAVLLSIANQNDTRNGHQLKKQH